MQKLVDILLRRFHSLTSPNTSADSSTFKVPREIIDHIINSFPEMSEKPIETIDIAEIGLTSDILDQLSDRMVGQTPLAPQSCPGECSKSSDDLKKLLGLLKNYWCQLEDPLDDRILQVMKEISIIGNDSRNDFSTKYKHLVRLSGDDMTQLLDDLIQTCSLGLQPLIASLKIAITAYTSALARNAKVNIAEIAVAATDLKTVAEMVSEQQEAFQSSAEHLSVAWNNLASSMTSYTSELDRKTLQLTNLSANPRSEAYQAPSTASDHTPDPQVGTRISIIPGFTYQSSYGSLTCTDKGDIGFVASTQSGVIIGRLIEVVQKRKPLEMLLNKDLNALIDYLISEPNFLACYLCDPPEVKIHKLQTVGKSVQDLTGQWIKISD